MAPITRAMCCAALVGTARAVLLDMEIAGNQQPIVYGEEKESPSVATRIHGDYHKNIKEAYLNRELTEREMLNVPRRLAQMSERSEEIITAKRKLTHKIKELDAERIAATTRGEKYAKAQELERLKKQRKTLTSEQEQLTEQTTKLGQVANAMRAKSKADTEALYAQRRAEQKEEMELQAEKQKERMESHQADKEEARTHYKSHEARKLAEHDRAARNLKAQMARERDVEFEEWKRAKYARKAAEQVDAIKERKAQAWADRTRSEENRKVYQEGKRIARELAAQSHKVHVAADGESKEDAEKRLRHVFFSDMMGDLSTSSMVDLFQALREAASNSSFAANVKHAGDDVTALADAYAESSRNKVVEFQLAAQQGVAEPQSLLPKVSIFMNESADVLREHLQGVRNVAARIRAAMSPRLMKNVASLMTTMSIKDREPLFFAADTLSERTGKADACEKMANYMEEISHYRDLSKEREMINAATKMLPTLGGLMPDLTPEVSSMMTSLANAGIVELNSLEKASAKIISDVAPTVQDKLHCAWSASNPRGLSLLAAALSLAVAWMQS